MTCICEPADMREPEGLGFTPEADCPLHGCLCSACGEVIEEGRRLCGAVTCGSCSVHSVHHTHR